MTAPLRQAVAMSKNRVDSLIRRVMAAGARTAREDQHWFDGDRSAPKTPWGPAQGAYNFAPGVRFFHTAGHGGLMVSPAAAKQLSGAAKKHGEYWGGAFWYEEDVAIAIPLYEMDAWREAAHRKAGWSDSKEGLERSIRSYFPQYFKMVEQGVTHAGPPRKGDRLRFEKQITFGTFVFEPGEEIVVEDVTRAYVNFRSPKNPNVRFQLRMRNIMSGDVVKVGSKTASWANVEIRAGRPAFEKVVSSWMPFPAFKDRRAALEATRGAAGAKSVALAVARVAGDEGQRLGFAFDGNPQTINALGFDVYKVVNGNWEWFADENRKGVYLASKTASKVGSASWALRVATGQQATFWLEVKGVRNRSVKDYEDANQGDSAIGGDFFLSGVLHVQPKGAVWTAQFPVNEIVSVSQHAASGTYVFNEQKGGPVDQLLGMALLDYDVQNAIVKALGKLEFVPYGSPKDPQEEAWDWLKNALRRQKLPTSSGVPRQVDAREFMLMNPEPVKGQWQFKHSDTRNYVFIDARSGKMTVPQTAQPFMKGEFDKFASKTAKLPTMDRDFYLPKAVRGQEPFVPEGTDLAVYLWEETGGDGKTKFYGIVFQGKATKPLWYHSFRDEASRKRLVDETTKSRQQSLDSKKQRMDDRRNFEHGLKVGDIFYSSWGYDQTNVDFYEVVGISGKQVAIRQIHEKVVRSDTSADYVVPMPGKFVSGEPVLKKIPSKGYQGTPYLRLNSFSGASLWDGKPKYQTGAYAGH